MTTKMTKLVVSLFATALLGAAGCGKSGEVGNRGLPPTIDLPKFQAAFPSPTPAQQSSIDKASEAVRYGLHANALAVLDKLAADPALTEAQKKAIRDLVAGIRETMSKAPPTPAR